MGLALSARIRSQKEKSTHYLKEDGTHLPRGGDLVQIAHRPRDRSSAMERKMRAEKEGKIILFEQECLLVYFT